MSRFWKAVDARPLVLARTIGQAQTYLNHGRYEIAVSTFGSCIASQAIMAYQSPGSERLLRAIRFVSTFLLLLFPNLARVMCKSIGYV
jgi:hypothetical protein